MRPRFSSEVVYFKKPNQAKTTRQSLSMSQLSQELMKHHISQEVSASTLDGTLKVQSYTPSATSSTSQQHRYKVKTYPKREFKKLNWGQDSYEGSILADNLHGTGFYITQQNGQKYFYDGLFYVNKLEGYSQIFYGDGTHFQGLFKEHLRFGAGVLSYPDGAQDVGFWNGFKLNRLICGVGENLVPSLASTKAGRAKLLCTRKMISLCEVEEKNFVKQTLLGVGAPEEAIESANEVLNIHIRNIRSQFFHKEYYDEEFFKGQPCSSYIKVFLDDDEEESEFGFELDGQGAEERIKNLENKISEVNDSLQTFMTIRLNLLQAVKTCKVCCTRSNVLEEETCKEETIQSDKTTVKSEDQASALTPQFDPSLGTIPTLSEEVTVGDVETMEEATPEEVAEMIEAGVCVCPEAEIPDSLRNVEEQLQNVTREVVFYRNIRDELQKKLDRLVEKEQNKQLYPKYKLVEVNSLWAWNNEDSMMDVQKHCFKHRFSEDMVNFSVSELILGNRKSFGSPGAHEQLCLKFLQACSKGKKDFVKDLLRTNQVNPNLADSRGNTGVFFAAAKNQQDIVSILTNFGAKLDQFNDQQLTPLSMTILMYLSVKHGFKDWETPFMNTQSTVCESVDLPEWYRVKSFASVASLASSTPVASSIHGCSNLRIIDLFRRMSNVEQAKGGIKTALRNPSYIFDMNCINPRTQTEEKTEDIVRELEAVHLTIITLLEYGANPNVGEVPYPALVLALFSENPGLVKEIIKANANISNLVEKNMSCLHIAASLHPCLENSSICRVLVKYGCNPNLLTSAEHWKDKKAQFTGEVPEGFIIPDTGKNALHLLCMRRDFQEDQSDYFWSVAKTLLETNLDIKKTYLGHTPLSLAVLSGNARLVHCLLKSQNFNPYDYLDYGMGNILTLYALKRFDNVLPENCKEVLTTLIDIDISLLNKIKDVENAIVFVEDEDHFFDEYAVKDDRERKDAKIKGKRSGKVDKKSQSFAMRDVMRNLARQQIIKQVQLQVTEALFEFIEEDMLGSHEIAITLASEYLTPSTAAANLKKLFEYKRFEHDRLDHINIKTLFEFTNAHQKITKKVQPKASKTEKSKPGKGNGPKGRGDVKENVKEDMEILVKSFDTTLNLNFVPHKFLLPPGLDDPSKYKVCYHCLRGQGKDLKLCPRCQMIYFCSAVCNKANVKLKSQHGCNVIFYDMSDEELRQITTGVELAKLIKETRKRCIDRLKSVRESKFEEEEKKLLEFWKKDTYGTKFLQIKPLLEKAVTTRRDKRLGWNIGFLKSLLEKNFQRTPGDTSLYSLEHLLLKLPGREWSRALDKEKSEATLRTRQSWSTRRSTMGGGSTLQSIIFQAGLDSDEDKFAIFCPCSKNKAAKLKPKSGAKKKEPTKKLKQHLIHYMEKERSNKFVEKQAKTGVKGVQESVQAAAAAVKRLKRIPDRYQKFVEIIATYFPEVDFSLWLLPYACCTDGQLYYKFCHNDDIFKESYSFS